MRSAVHIKGHPLHPLLIPFPIAFFTGALVSDIVAQVVKDAGWAVIAIWLSIAGIVMALIAAVPGLIDYFKTVPPNSTGKSRATKHMLLNITVVILFVVANFTRMPQTMMPMISTLAIELVAFLLLCSAGWMGGTLTYRNQIGVDHRYADAGKWQVQNVSGTGEIEVGKTNDLQANQMKLVIANGKRVVLGRKEGLEANSYVAFDDRCSHRGGSLADGAMICGTVQCPWHGSQFDCATGEVKAGPAKEKIATYPVTITEDRIYIRL